MIALRDGEEFYAYPYLGIFDFIIWREEEREKRAESGKK